MRRAYLAELTVMISRDVSADSLSSVAGQLGGVAALLGGSVGSSRDVNEALATLRSKLLTEDFLQRDGRLDELLRVLSGPNLKSENQADQLQTAVDLFQSRILAVGYDVRSNLVTVSITWIDRQLASQWANAYVALANEVMRLREIKDARNRLEFLKREADKAQTLDLRQAIYRLMETQVRSEMLATTKPEFAFRVVDPATPPLVKDYVRPKSWLISLTGALFGGLFTSAVMLWRRPVQLD